MESLADPEAASSKLRVLQKVNQKQDIEVVESGGTDLSISSDVPFCTATQAYAG